MVIWLDDSGMMMTHCGGAYCVYVLFAKQFSVTLKWCCEFYMPNCACSARFQYQRVGFVFFLMFVLHVHTHESTPLVHTFISHASFIHYITDITTAYKPQIEFTVYLHSINIPSVVTPNEWFSFAPSDIFNYYSEDILISVPNINIKIDVKSYAHSCIV